jgi:hypothetical protein
MKQTPELRAGKGDRRVDETKAINSKKTTSQ